MYKNKRSIIIIFLFVLLLIALLMSGKFIMPKKPSQYEIKDKRNKNDQTIKSVNLYDDKAPEIKNKGKWINTDKELTLEDLKGKVVLIEFWTFGCYNCTNTLPYLKDWYGKYKSDSFEMIGIHCPEFDNERNFENVKTSVEELGIKYPVLTDNEFSIWRKFDVHAWPTIFLIDKKGEIRYKKVGEGKYDKTENMIQTLLKESPEEIRN